MKRICAWCNTHLGETAIEKGREESVTHTICESCFDHFYGEENKQTLKNLLDKFQEPFLIIEPNMQIDVANEAALHLLRKTQSEVDHHLGGEIIDCVYSRLPGGCGKTERCKGCTIRMVVTETHATGKAQAKVSAVQEIRTPDGVKKIKFIVSTEKLKSFVLLKINEISVP